MLEMIDLTLVAAAFSSVASALVDDGVRRVAVYEDVGQAAHELAQLLLDFVR